MNLIRKFRVALAVVAAIVLAPLAGIGAVYASSAVLGVAAQVEPAPSQTLSLIGILIAFLASAAGAAWLSGKLEGWAWFQRLSSNGKVLSSVVILGALAVLIDGLRLFLTSRPDIVELIEPRVVLLLPLINLAVANIRHGSNKPASNQ